MTVEVRPLNVLCNIQCQYCYQDPQRFAGKIPRSYDLDKIKEAVVTEGGPFSIFGGEPLLLPMADLENLWEWGNQQYGKNSMQTNGTLITDEHIRLFKKYNVSVGMSIDGPGELNDARWHGDVERTRQSTAKSLHNLARLCEEGLKPALIITLHRINASAERLPLLLDWVLSLGRMGVTVFKLHLLESENALIRAKLGLTTQENIAALLGFRELERAHQSLRWNFNLFSEMRRLLMGDDRQVQCVWKACDPYTTEAVRGIEGQGQRTNCGRTNKDGIDFTKGSVPGFERYLSLYQTPQELGGCKDCRFFLMCKGQCPGTAIDGDWRNRTEHCEVWKTIFEIMEGELEAAGKTPLSLDSRRQEIEHQAIAVWTRGKNVSLAGILNLPPKPNKSVVANREMQTK